MTCHWLSRWIYDNRAMMGASAWLVFSSIVLTAPEPDAKFGWRTLYGWAIDAAHQLLNLKRPTGAAEKPLQRIN